MSNDSISKTLLVTVLLCLGCSILVSVAAVMLKPAQQANKLLDKQKNILLATGLYDSNKSVTEQFAHIEKRIVHIETGLYAGDEIDVATYDQRQAQRNPELSVAIPANIDIASLKRRPVYAEVYQAYDAEGRLKILILPISGYGLWSTMYGFLALEGDLNTVAGLTFYDHAETPGLGAEVDNPRWKAQWLGKKIFDEQGHVAARLKKGTVNSEIAYEQEHFVDGLSGATITSNGVSHLIAFWMGEHGFGPYLDKLAERLDGVSGEADDASDVFFN